MSAAWFLPFAIGVFLFGVSGAAIALAILPLLRNHGRGPVSGGCLDHRTGLPQNILLVAPYPAAMFRATADRADARGLVLKDNLFDLRQWLRLGVRVVERKTHVKTKSLISWLAMLALVFGAQPGVTADGDSQKKKPPAQDTYTITQLDTGANVASSGQLISDNQVVAGNLQGDALFAFAWSAQTGFVVLTLGGSSSLVSGMSSNGIVSGAADTPGETEVIGFIWTPANGLVTIGNLGGG